MGTEEQKESGDDGESGGKHRRLPPRLELGPLPSDLGHQNWGIWWCWRGELACAPLLRLPVGMGRENETLGFLPHRDSSFYTIDICGEPFDHNGRVRLRRPLAWYELGQIGGLLVRPSALTPFSLLLGCLQLMGRYVVS